MVDMVLDLRIGSPTIGKIILFDMPSQPDSKEAMWIWVPPGFAHGNFFTEESAIEYFCTAEYKPENEAGIMPLADDIDWSLADPFLKRELDNFVGEGALVLSEKDKNALSLAAWLNDPRSVVFKYGEL
jgi:dTDP-4-dehydrorhamnose 3,5-epimerase-like enzyme